MSVLARPFALLGSIATSFGETGRFEHLFSLSDADLARRGYDRDGLVRTYISGMGHS